MRAQTHWGNWYTSIAGGRTICSLTVFGSKNKGLDWKTNGHIRNSTFVCSKVTFWPTCLVKWPGSDPHAHTAPQTQKVMILELTTYEYKPHFSVPKPALRLRQPWILQYRHSWWRQILMQKSFMWSPHQVLVSQRKSSNVAGLAQLSRAGTRQNLTCWCTQRVLATKSSPNPLKSMAEHKRKRVNLLKANVTP